MYRTSKVRIFYVRETAVRFISTTSSQKKIQKSQSVNKSAQKIEVVDEDGPYLEWTQ